MKAFVLSGGGNYGALQAGALEVLLDRGIHPDILVGVSAGALNAAFLAADPTVERVYQLQEVWCASAPKFFKPPNHVSMLLRLFRRQDGLLTNDSLQHFVRTWAPTEFGCFRDIRQCQLYVIASRLADGTMRVFGENDADSLFDALMASTAVPPLFPPWSIDGEAYVDGGISSDLPILVAAQHGADEIYALQATLHPERLQKTPKGVIEILARVFSALIDRSVQYEIAALRQHHNIRFHHIRLYPSANPGLWDFTHSAELIHDGRQLTEEYLASVVPKPQQRFALPVSGLRWLQGKNGQLQLEQIGT